MGDDDPRPERLPGYDEIVERNSITLLMKPGDLTLRNGDLAVTRRGDLMLNDEDYSAFTRLVQVWRCNFPTLRTLFGAAFDMGGEDAAKQDLDAMGSRRWDPSLGLLQGLDVDAYHAFARDISPEILALLTGGDFLRLEAAIFAFANDLVSRRRLRLTSR